MKRKNFIKIALLTGLVTVFKTSSAKTIPFKETPLGFNHLPNQEETTMTTVLHKAATRGHANHGWLNSHHTFSFANYHNPERMNFGVLRVLNDDEVAPNRGFGKHPHNNMEIISIPLEGDLEHQDSIGTVSVIKKGDIQVMSAGTGVTHSEMNKNKGQAVKFLQIWVFPKMRQASPRYDQISMETIAKKNQFYQVLSPNKDDQGVWINQDAWFHIGNFDQGSQDQYDLQKTGNGIYVFVLEGSVRVNGQVLERRDGYGLWDIKSIAVTAITDAQVLLMEVPMNA